MKISCSECNVATDLEIRFDVASFACPNCQSLYTISPEGMRLHTKFKYQPEDTGLAIGQKGILRKEEYTVTGSLVKKTYGKYYWREYILQNASGDFVYLSEADGHWILLTDIEEKHNVKDHPPYIDHGDMRLNLYEYTDAEIVAAQGYFDFVVPDKKVSMFEYISPPYCISIERLNDVENNFLGEHISKAEIRKAFPSLALPYQHGVGIVQPFYLNVKNTAIIFCATAILIFASHALIYSNRAEETVLSKDFLFSDFINKDFVSPSFTLEGGSAPMTVSAQTNTNNSWANVQVALINETTNEEVYANKDVEYYHGYTDGENWTEGDNNEKFYLCGVNAGKYHLTITPQKATEDQGNLSMKVDVVWSQPSTWNAWIPIVLMGLAMIGVYYLNVNFERTRWAESDYSPFDEEE
ncbi:DUF4178 domain-containing protein [Flavobacterium humi]|uniref:DUF4178 domain-containing protein n=1 Tax=Flavobacterium humi TaxID=2562683 RepID=A0A4Z0L9H0_9FLAO|nr:DUF4178 domain-containing protein [Flavobacterium humi]TGD57643.1 DUF4178 domain-containing protein [Flavobacterium humi]